MATPRSNIVRLRLTDLEKKDWQTAAGGARKLSEWIRAVCNAAAQPAVRPDMTDLMISPEAIDVALAQESPPGGPKGDAFHAPEGPTAAASDPIPNAKPVIVAEAIADEQDAALGTPRGAASVEHPESRDASKGQTGSASGAGTVSGQCPRWMHHRPGTYCGSCKKVPLKK